jgi:hypothetical protein
MCVVSETLTEKQIALEELKFCLITCETVYNTKLVELISLSKQSVSWANHLPKFNRRTAVTAIERGMLETDYTLVLVRSFCFITIRDKSACVDGINITDIKIWGWFQIGWKLSKITF